LLRLLQKPVDPVVAVDIHHAEAENFVGINLDGCQRDVRARVVVLLQHPPIIHLVDVIAGEN
jgi:hypothetical protein